MGESLSTWTPSCNGSIRVEGEFEIVDPQGAAFGLGGRKVIGLCRCGLSANKPCEETCFAWRLAIS